MDFSGTSTIDSTYEEIVREILDAAVSADVGKVLFVAVDTAEASGDSRLDYCTLFETPLGIGTKEATVDPDCCLTPSLGLARTPLEK